MKLRVVREGTIRERQQNSTTYLDVVGAPKNQNLVLRASVQTWPVRQCYQLCPFFQQQQHTMRTCKPQKATYGRRGATVVRCPNYELHEVALPLAQ
eukprot:47769-Amphidinium_carterae.1